MTLVHTAIARTSRTNPPAIAAPAALAQSTPDLFKAE
jgi:hypothetical protein